MTIGENIQTLRKSRGLSQEALAAQLRVSRQAVSKWENNLSCPDITILPELVLRGADGRETAEYRRIYGLGGT